MNGLTIRHHPSLLDKEIIEILKRLESKVDENTQILRALEHSSQINKADIARLEEIK